MLLRLLFQTSSWKKQRNVVVIGDCLSLAALPEPEAAEPKRKKRGGCCKGKSDVVPMGPVS